METANTSKIDVTKALKMVMLEKDLKQYEVGVKLGMKERQSFNRILLKNTALRVDEIVKIANALNCDVKISLVEKETGKVWVCNTEAG